MIEYYDMYIFVTRLIYVVTSLNIGSKMAMKAILLWYISSTFSTMVQNVSSLSSHQSPHFRLSNTGLDHDVQLFKVVGKYEGFIVLSIWLYKHGFT
jgi:hypothetical protein